MKNECEKSIYNRIVNGLTENVLEYEALLFYNYFLGKMNEPDQKKVFSDILNEDNEFRAKFEFLKNNFNFDNFFGMEFCKTEAEKIEWFSLPIKELKFFLDVKI